MRVISSQEQRDVGVVVNAKGRKIKNGYVTNIYPKSKQGRPK